MIPLCTTTMRPVQSRCGWAFSSVGRPCVAQRVWPMPYSPSSGLPASDLLEPRQLAGAAPQLDRAVADHRDARRVIAAILEPPQPVDQDREDLLVADVTDDPAHAYR